MPDAWKLDGSELRDTLEGTEHEKRDERCGNRMRKRKRCGIYSVGVKDLASAYVLCPCLTEYWGLSIYGRTEVTE